MTRMAVETVGDSSQFFSLRLQARASLRSSAIWPV
jgi:hypothetical protein